LARQPRKRLPARGVFHITARGVERRAIFLDDDDRRLFVALLELAQQRHEWKVLAYCLMTNHIHVLVDARRADLSAGAHLLIGRYAQLFNDRYERTGHLFQGRFHARAVEDDEYLAYVCDYVFDNPIRAGLCRDRAEWPWLGGALAA
jgi:REP element-mobilizing transposase RayT